jgi:WD40 repeat protein
LVDCVAFDDTGNRLATGSHDGRLRIFDLTKDNVMKQIDAHIVTMPQTLTHPIYAVHWSRDYRQVLTASFDKSIKLWDAASGNLVREFAPFVARKNELKKDDKKEPQPIPPDAERQGHRDQVFSLALSKDGQFLATASSDGTVKLWEVATGKVIRDFPNPDMKPVFPEEPAPSHPGWVHAVCFDPRGRLVSAGGAPKGRSYIAVWDIATGKRLYGAEHPFGPIHAIEVLDENRVVIGTASVPRNKTPATAAILQLPVK